jgi:hypothetical protein
MIALRASLAVVLAMLAACGANPGSIHVVSDSAPTNAAAVRIAAFYSDSCSPITGCPAPPETKNPSVDNGNRGKESNQAADDAIR